MWNVGYVITITSYVVCVQYGSVLCLHVDVNITHILFFIFFHHYYIYIYIMVEYSYVKCMAKIGTPLKYYTINNNNSKYR